MLILRKIKLVTIVKEQFVNSESFIKKDMKKEMTTKYYRFYHQIFF